ncbi:T9SS type A sorting domain-containing protein [Rasiella rasia]|uniref:T9SS type A sorting domain-containing protein n=1 Tax=Rasiella rasia TaxID=2744027 RepID=A0A6G6GPG9_9FLAO|nr:M36 family metallopeptidase [Rasiella rasia]QIE60449.1 T9SS type A sorting domain-containing protein [Rasiella rasia]
MKNSNIPIHRSYWLVVLLAIFTLQVSVSSAQVVKSKSVDTPNIDIEKLLERNDKVQYSVTSEYTSKLSGIHHTYLRQLINGIEVCGTESSIHKNKLGKTVMLHNNFVGDIETTVTNSSVDISPDQAISRVANQMGYALSNLQLKENFGGANQKALYSKSGISKRDIPVQLMYYYREGHGTQLVWELSVLELDDADWWNFRVDAVTGLIIDKDNFMVSCKNDGHTDHEGHNVKNSNNTISFEDLSVLTNECEEENFMMMGSYNVFAMPIETPNHGARTLVTNAENATASPFGWHSNGATSFSDTNGNNVIAREDRDNNNSGGFQPSENTANQLDFDFPLNLTYVDANGQRSQEASITNLFYWNNIIHDVTYQYGFDEVSGNFQWNNNGNGGAEVDPVIAEAQDGSGTCNANFGTPADGGVPLMQMYVCGDRDGSLDNGVVIHEYGHGISNRLTGGPGVANGLQNIEQMGEGWSDYFGLMLTMEPGDQGADQRGIGTWLTGEDITGTGIRTFPYSTDFGVNSLTYDDINSEAQPHGVGTVWASMLWDMTWLMIDAHGYSPDLYTVTGDENIDAGNIQALALVMEGLKLQGSSPGFEDGRDAILAADLAIYNGVNQCYIWEAFANRGMGASASQGSSASTTDGTPAFDLPATIGGFENSIENACLNGGTLTGLTGGFPSGGTYAGPGVTNTGGNTYSFNPISAGVGTHTITYTVNDFCNNNNSTVFSETIAVQDDVLALTCPADMTVQSDTHDVCSAVVVFEYPRAEGDLCDSSNNDLSQNTVSTIGAALDCTDAPSGHLRTFNLTTEGVSRDYTIDGIDIAINTNSGVAPVIVNIYLSTQLPGGVVGERVPLSGAIDPYASETSLVPAGNNFTHTVPMNVFLPAGSVFHVEVITPSSRNQMLGYNDAGGGAANETATGYINCVGGDYLTLSSIGFGDLASLIEISGTESNEYTTVQTAGQAPGSTFTAGTTTNTFTTTRQSGGTSTCSFDVVVKGKSTIFAGGVWNPVVPSAGSNAQFSDNFTTTAEGNVNACSCEIDSGATVTVAAGDFLNIYGDITVDGTLIVAHQGSIVQVDPSAVVTKTGTINVEVTTPVLQTRDFMVMGSPMDDETRNGVFSSAFLVLDHDPDMFNPNTHPNIPQGATNFKDLEGDYWSIYSGDINPGEGYIVRPQSGYGDPANTTFDMTYAAGTLNNGTVNRPMIYNSTNSPAGTPNTYSNPYASAIDADKFIQDNGLNALYFWEHLTPPTVIVPGESIMFDMDDVSVRNFGGGVAANNDNPANIPNGVISTGQGFAIKATSNGSVNFTNDMRLTTGNTTLRSNELEVDRLWLHLESNTYGLANNLLIGFNPAATDGWDNGYDTDRLASSVGLYSHLDVGTGTGEEQMAIQTRGAFQSSEKIHVGFSSLIEEHTLYTISLSNYEGSNLSDTSIYLYDSHMNVMTDLTQGDYEFRSSKATNNRRFTVSFEPDNVLATGAAALENITMFPNPTDGVLNITAPGTTIETIKIYDVRGRAIILVHTDATQHYQLDMSQLGTAMYFVEITTPAGKVTKRIVRE